MWHSSGQTCSFTSPLGRVIFLILGAKLNHSGGSRVEQNNNKRESHPALSPQLTDNFATMNFGILILAPVVLFCSLSWAEIQKSSLDFSKATVNPETGGLCIMQEICIDDLSALAKNLPPGPCVQNDPDCNCVSDDECGGGSAKYVFFF